MKNRMFDNNDENVFGYTNPVRGESKYVEWDYDTHKGFGVYGRSSGHRYGLYSTAHRALVDHPDAD